MSALLALRPSFLVLVLVPTPLSSPFYALNKSLPHQRTNATPMPSTTLATPMSTPSPRSPALKSTNPPPSLSEVEPVFSSVTPPAAPPAVHPSSFPSPFDYVATSNPSTSPVPRPARARIAAPPCPARSTRALKAVTARTNTHTRPHGVTSLQGLAINYQGTECLSLSLRR